MPTRKKGKTKHGADRSNALLAAPRTPDMLPDMPLDVLMEIFKLLKPRDLLRLSRTTKAFRGFLMNRANAGVWRQASANVKEEDGDPPGCPSYMSEPAWASLLYDRLCKVCLATLTERPDVDSVWWEFSARYCVDCPSSQVSKSIPIKLKRSMPNSYIEWERVFPRTPSQGNGFCYPIVEIRKFIDVFLATESLEERKVLLRTQQDQTFAIMEHSRLCRTWADKKVQQRRNQIVQQRLARAEKERALRDSRLQVIVTKLNALGWTDEPWMFGGTLSHHLLCSSHVNLGKALTAAAWRVMEVPLIQEFEQMKGRHVMLSRLTVFQRAFPRIIDMDKLELSVRPNLTDIAMLPEVRALLDLEGDGGVVEEELVTVLGSTMPQLLTAWSDNAMTRLRAHVREQLKLPMQTADPVDPDPLALAIAYIPCPRCEAASCVADLLKHKCNSSKPMQWTLRPAVEWMHKPVRGTLAGYEGWVVSFHGHHLWTPTILDFSLSGMTRKIVEAYGLDPATTTYDAMLHETRRLNCASCVVEGFNWLGAIEHYKEYHLGNINGEDPNMVCEDGSVSH
ncbi:hypothetical protein B0H10DRAFT_2088024 [Mycena sp. CBHHK59/15]|nr:hypothetical protein B0H10DRAFT_2088024 [Mycena sp. CBHHK59/15]